ncbi:hypothetical protein ABZ027_36890 [Streptomyces sp. NPDC006332]|uniref:hypothetical protein n=1 Tax=Streptomyces sp. NPDC006332 TaxID=3155456 RepID=UPI0033A6AFCA
MTDATYPAAWVPDQASEAADPDQAAQLAVDWVLKEAQRLQTEPLLITASKDVWTLGLAPITWFASNYPATTPRARNPRGGRGPVLAYLPNYKLMYMAANCAQGSSLVAVEHRMDPLNGWAMEVGARNLLTGETTPDTRTESVHAGLEFIHANGNNGWAKGFGQDRARDALRDLQSQGRLDRDTILGYMAAKGHSGESVYQLAKIIDVLR